MMEAEITQVIFIAFGAGTLAGITIFLVSWAIVSALNIVKKII